MYVTPKKLVKKGAAMRRCYACGTMNTDEALVCENCDQPIERPVTKGWVRYAGIGLLVAILSAPLLWFLSVTLGSGEYPLTSLALVLGILALMVGVVTYRLRA